MPIYVGASSGTAQSIISGTSIKMPAATTDPSDNTSGGMYFNSNTSSLRVRGATSWGNLTRLGSSAGTPASSCRAIVAAGDDAGNGYYWLNVGSFAGQTWCNMTFNPTNAGFGRGWTKVGNGCTTNTGAVNAPTQSLLDQYNDTSNWKMSDSTITTILQAGYGGIWLRTTSQTGSDTSRLVKFNGNPAWTSNAQMTGTPYMWNGSGWIGAPSTCASTDYGPSMCGMSGWYFGTENYTSATGAASDLRWYYTGWGASETCLIRTTWGGQGGTNNYNGNHGIYVY